MQQQLLPSQQRMITAYMERDASFEGIFVTAVKTTGIFCRPTCPARKPKPENVEFFPGAKEAIAAGYRSCKRCKPMQAIGSVPDWLDALIEDVEQNIGIRWKDGDLRQRGLEPERVRRWFKTNHNMTFHAYVRQHRLGAALGNIKNGDSLLDAAFYSGYESLSGFNSAFSKILGLSPSQSKSAIPVNLARVTTPLGPMLAAATNEALCLLEFTDRRMLETQFKRISQRMNCTYIFGKNKIIKHLEVELAEYFAGDRRNFSLPLLVPGTDFQEKVWAQLQQIPYGESQSYSEMAKRMNQPKAVRAVGRANGDNRIAIIIPCHRVIGADGSLTGYGGGFWRKQRLLELEAFSN